MYIVHRGAKDFKEEMTHGLNKPITQYRTIFLNPPTIY